MSRCKLFALLALTVLPVPVEAATYTVRELAGRVFSPANLTIAVGDTVTWRNDDTMGHTTTSGTEGAPDRIWDSGDMPPGATYSHTFTAAGAFPYYCDYHSNMSGSITVVAAAATVQQLPGRQFSPTSVTVGIGETVLWVNADTMGHTTTSGPEGAPDLLFDSGDMPAGTTFAHTFTAAGTFPYYCDYHSGMTGEVIVRSTVPTPAVLTATKSGSNVVVTWTGGSPPFTLLRGEDSALADLAPLPGPWTSPYTDPLALLTPPSLYFYHLP